MDNISLGSRKLFSQIVDKSPFGIMVSREDSTITFANPAAQKMLQGTEEELLGKKWNDINNCDSSALNTLADSQVYFDQDFKFIFLTPKQELGPLYNPNFFEDLKCQGFLDSQSDGWWVWDFKNDRVILGSKLKTYLGVESLEDSPSNLLDLFFSEDRAHLLDVFEILRKDPSSTPSFTKRIRLNHKDGSIKSVVCKGLLIEDENGKPTTYFIGLHYDISKIVDLNEKLVASNRELRRQTKEMEQIIYTISHDLKSPIVTIQGFLGFLQEDLESGDYQGIQKSLDRLTSANSRMGDLTNDLLRLSRIGHRNQKFECIEVDQMIAELLKSMSTNIKESDEIRVAAMPTVICDRLKLSQAFDNILSNAFQYGRGKDGLLKLSIDCIETPSHFTFYFEDHGSGIEPRFHNKIFELFQKLENSNGTGVGLTIVRKVAKLHGGESKVKSIPGKGSVFEISVSKTCHLDDDARSC